MNRKIVFSVCRDVRRMPLVGHLSRLDKGAGPTRKMVISQGRFGRRCYYCDFAFGTSEIFEIHNLDGDHTNNSQENTVPICELCHAPFHIDLISKKWPSDPGKIIFLPEMTQIELNNLLQAVFYSMSIQRQTANSLPEEVEKEGTMLNAHTIYFNLQKRAESIEHNHDGDLVRGGLSRPVVMSRVLADMNDEMYGQRETILAGCRFLPPLDYFVERAAAWGDKSAAFSRLDPASWDSVARKTQ